MNRSTIRLARIAGGVIAGTLVLAGCSGGSDSDASASSSSSSSNSSSSASESADFNDADVTFAQDMIVHHQGALEMAQLADGRAQDQRVLDLASRIEAAQQPEIDTMTGWLEDWGQPVASDDMGDMDMGDMDMGDMDMGDMDMGGMDMDMSGLEAASGTEFDRMFLEMMTEHHQGAVDMANTEVADGQNEDAVALARQIISDQTSEIEEMQTILSELGS
ncbi:DUF305 domain-containing protein [Modestobacter altitudinis]|uniref:DUF305 domain-containing protein n=1 Tax=Modestobacter altitudinis TaxID=2213158 RepID=UPI00110CDD95|nr:DUF305 domain-containing protein [Modestobacter altitudinis]